MQEPYNYTYTQDQGYTFTTDYSIDYTAYFTDGSDYFSDFPEFKDNVVSFGFARINSATNNKKQQDDRIQYTVTSILENYLNSDPKVIILFICDTKDRQHQARKILFDKWYSSDNNKGSYYKIDEDVCTEEDCTYCSVIFHRDNPNESLIAQGFYSIAQQLRNK